MEHTVLSRSNIEKIELIINEVESYIKNKNENKLLDEKNVSELKIALANLIEMKKDISNDEDAAELLAEISHFMHQQKLAPDFPDQINSLVDKIDKIIAWDVQFAPLAYPKDSLKIDEIKWQKVENLLCFRGDNRNPDGLYNIFENGFFPKKLIPDKLIVSSLFETQDGVVAGSSRFLSAALFPFHSSINKTWVYVYAPDEIFDVHTHGCVRTLDERVRWDFFNEQAYSSLYFASFMYAHEIIAKCIPSERIIAAVCVERFFNKKRYEGEYFFSFYNKFGSYHILEYRMNLYCTLSKDIISRAEKFIKDEIAANLRSCHLPLPTSGYVRNGLFAKNKKKTEEESKSTKEDANEKKIKEVTKFMINGYKS